MKLKGDSLQFEHRSEVDNISVALQEWLETHVNDPKSEDVKKAIDKLEALYIGW